MLGHITVPVQALTKMLITISQEKASVGTMWNHRKQWGGGGGSWKVQLQINSQLQVQEVVCENIS